ncbi:UDP-3-O-acyl-N-acetylglucosamine deacetylase [Halomicronema hongdechloris C2206]|uniref:UDP-3-O-acyl-N-acetylglucosamine deacetylase n=1 Tax=Halomicronema hongdechloris C2206 TaxID=1641165 RepID=A0A1Z3HLA3_9CYAN|nr:UDP-3-O-acyl-N-acetylglucosamine deacetylase [Halomicronema hongdechloris]ASC70877.1 UDP-3-O-acyl-N-acetylglucosamine deacetylase [Halomicronema hongdechloris C2206]
MLGSPASFLSPGSPGALLRPQGTLATSFERTGIGLHSGQQTTVRVMPAPVNSGRWFVRRDLPQVAEIPATVAAVQQTQLSTELGGGGAAIRTVEHLLAALTAMGIDNGRIEMDGPEVPLLDGSAREWVLAIEAAGRISQGDPRAILRVTHPTWIHRGDAFVAALPAETPRFTYGIDFDLAAIGNQWHSWAPGAGEAFQDAIAPARTFGLADQIEQLRAMGLIQGGSLDNALVCGSEGWLNPPLRFANEPVRHKLLDLIGDLSLLGTLPQAHVVAYKASHQLHVQLVKTLVDQGIAGS